MAGRHVKELGPPPWVVKDHVKSTKEHWHRACFVPDGATYEEFTEVCDQLLQIRGDRFERGFVVRKHVDLATLPGWAPQPAPRDRRAPAGVLGGPAGIHAPNYDEEATLEDPGQSAVLGRAIGSPFFTANVARLASGGFTVIEINDGGSAMFPEQMHPREFYRAALG